MGLRKLDNTGTWMVNSSPIYIPDADITIEHNNLVSEASGRDESGYNHIKWLRRDVRKVGLRYAMMTGDELKYLRNLMQGQEFEFTYAEENGTTTIDAYTGEMQATLFTRIGGVDIYKDVSVNVIEK